MARDCKGFKTELHLTSHALLSQLKTTTAMFTVTVIHSFTAHTERPIVLNNIKSEQNTENNRESINQTVARHDYFVSSVIPVGITGNKMTCECNNLT
jgi:methyltransferase-like protein